MTAVQYAALLVQAMDVEVVQTDDSPLYRDITVVACESNFVSGSYVDRKVEFPPNTADACDQTNWTQAKERGPTYWWSGSSSGDRQLASVPGWCSGNRRVCPTRTRGFAVAEVLPADERWMLSPPPPVASIP
jgi:hypothetical protein